MCVCAVDISLPVLVDTKAMLSCHPAQLTTVILVMWEIILRDTPVCIRQYRRDKNETVEVNCTDKRITWASTPDQNSTLRIDPVAVTHDGYYSCQMVIPNGNFHRGYHLQVLGKDHHILWYFRQPDLGLKEMSL